MRLQGLHRFTVQSLADEFAVSKRTMLRDLQALSELGVPLTSSPGPHGGYQLIRNQKLPPLSLTAEEAIALVASYESLHEYAETPFDVDTSASMAKIRAALPSQTAERLDAVRACLVILGARRTYVAPYLRPLLDAAINKRYVRIRYDSRSGASTRVIYPFGLFASNGFWYCGCFDYKRNAHLSLRVDRVLEVMETVRPDELGALRPPDPITFRQWLQTRETAADNTVTLRAKVTTDGVRFADWTEFVPYFTVHADGTGSIEMEIRPEDIDYYAWVFIRVGSEAVVIHPPELVTAIQHKLTELWSQYRPAAPLPES